MRQTGSDAVDTDDCEIYKSEHVESTITVRYEVSIPRHMNSQDTKGVSQLPVITNGWEGSVGDRPIATENSLEHSRTPPIPMPAGLEPLKHQLAGHRFCEEGNKELYGILDCKDGTILKPVILDSRKGQRERYFYALLADDSSHSPYFNFDVCDFELLRQLKKFTAVYKGLVSLPEHPEVIYIKMVDVCSTFTRPHIIDVKIGAKCWEPAASPEKIKRQKQRCPHLDEICFQVLGAKYYDAQTGEAVVRRDLRKCTPHDLLHKGLHAIFNILPPNAKESITQFIMDDLQEIARWFGSQSILSFHGSSVLIVFEGDKATLDSNVETNHNRHPSLLKVKMIDFAHVFQTRASDDNYLEGLNSLISYFQSLSHIFRSTSPVTDKAS